MQNGRHSRTLSQILLLWFPIVPFGCLPFLSLTLSLFYVFASNWRILCIPIFRQLLCASHKGSPKELHNMRAWIAPKKVAARHKFVLISLLFVFYSMKICQIRKLTLAQFYVARNSSSFFFRKSSLQGIASNKLKNHQIIFYQCNNVKSKKAKEKSWSFLSLSLSTHSIAMSLH